MYSNLSSHLIGLKDAPGLRVAFIAVVIGAPGLLLGMRTAGQHLAAPAGHPHVSQSHLVIPGVEGVDGEAGHPLVGGAGVPIAPVAVDHGDVEVDLA